MTTDTIDRAAQVLWNYHQLNQKIVAADCIIVLGSQDTRVAQHGAELFCKGLAPVFVCSGGRGQLTASWKHTEADVFASIAIKHGISKDRILLEKRSTNTYENLLFTKKLLEQKQIMVNTAIFVSLPYMERRVFATSKKIWPELDVIVTSPRLTYEEYPDATTPKDLLIHMMVGYLQRIKIYPEKGFQISQDIPQRVLRAYETLVHAEYTDFLVHEY
ncbi:MAG: YdcF family protein [Candidatus Aenigmarchaeota archaeon]|nr:YdcF family protein [Candidatus Aenigmarchaeota archaeon]